MFISSDPLNRLQPNRRAPFRRLQNSDRIGQKRQSSGKIIGLLLIFLQQRARRFRPGLDTEYRPVEMKAFPTEFFKKIHFTTCKLRSENFANGFVPVSAAPELVTVSL